jgi:hypothetical protein
MIDWIMLILPMATPVKGFDWINVLHFRVEPYVDLRELLRRLSWIIRNDAQYKKENAPAILSVAISSVQQGLKLKLFFWWHWFLWDGYQYCFLDSSTR